MFTTLQVLLVQVDVKEPHHALRQLMRVAILCDLTLMLAWSHQEAGQILETYKAMEDKPADMIMEKSNPDPHSKLVDALTSVKSGLVNIKFSFSLFFKTIGVAFVPCEVAPKIDWFSFPVATEV